MKGKVDHFDYKVSRPYCRSFQQSGDKYKWTDAQVVTKRGIVTIYMQDGSTGYPCTVLFFAFRGRAYTQKHERAFTQRRIVTLADRFTKAVTHG